MLVVVEPPVDNESVAPTYTLSPVPLAPLPLASTKTRPEMEYLRGGVVGAGVGGWGAGNRIGVCNATI